MTSTTVDRRFGVNVGLAIKAPCTVATTANITLYGEQTIDGVVTADVRVLVKNQTNGAQNGIYLSSSGDWTREPDFDGVNDVTQGTIIYVANGTTLSDSYWILTNSGVSTIGTTPLTFSRSNLDPNLRTDLAAVTGAALVGFKQAETNAISQTVQAALRGRVLISQYATIDDAVASGRRLWCPNGTYQIPTNTTVAGYLDIEGETRDGVILEGSGDLFNLTTVNSTINLATLTLQNSAGGSRGKLISLTYGSDINKSTFFNVYFKKADYHVYTDRGFGVSIVNWSFEYCYFIDATTASRQYGAVWVLTEFRCYTWYCGRGIKFRGNVSTVGILSSTFELNNYEAINIDVLTNANIIGLLLMGTHFEANGQTAASSAIVCDGDPATAIIKGMSLINCQTFAETATPTVSIPTPTNITNWKMHVEGCADFTFSTPANGVLWTSIEYRSDGRFTTVGKVTSITGFSAGNNVVQAGPIALAIGEAHRVVVREYANSSGADVGFFQEFVVHRSSYGTMKVLTVVNTAPGGDGCVISTGSGNYSVQTGPAMTHSITPYVDATRI